MYQFNGTGCGTGKGKRKKGQSKVRFTVESFCIWDRSKCPLLRGESFLVKKVGLKWSGESFLVKKVGLK